MKFTRLFHYVKPHRGVLLMVLERRTVIMITHCPATVALANRVVKMQDARILPGAHF